MVADPSLSIREIERWPVRVVKGSPDRVVAVDDDRIFNAHGFENSSNVFHVLLKRELRRVYADHHESMVFVFRGPGTNIGKLALPVNTGISAEIDQNHFATQVSRF